MMSMILLSLIAISGCRSADVGSQYATCSGQCKNTSQSVETTSEKSKTSTSETYSGDGWKLTVPSAIKRGTPKNPERIQFAGIDPVARRIVLLVREEVSDETNLQDFTERSKLGMVANDMKILSEESGESKSSKYMHVVALKEPLVIHNWMLLKSNLGYTLVCAGVPDDPSQHAKFCTDIFKSLHLK